MSLPFAAGVICLLAATSLDASPLVSQWRARVPGIDAETDDALIVLDRASRELVRLDRGRGKELSRIKVVDPEVWSAKVLAARGTAVVIGDGLHLVGIDARSGKIAWRHDMPGLGKQGAAYAPCDGDVIVRRRAVSRDQTTSIVERIDAATGATMWSLVDREDRGKLFGDPQCEDAHLVIYDGGPRDDATTVTAIDAAHGHVAWVRHLAMAGSFEAAWASDHLVIAQQHDAYVLDARGQRKLLVQLHHVGGDGNRLYGLHGQDVVAIAVPSGRTLWTTRFSSVLDDARLLETSSARVLLIDKGSLFELDPATGNQRWTYALPAATDIATHRGTPLITYATTVAGGYTEIVAMDPER